MATTVAIYVTVSDMALATKRNDAAAVPPARSSLRDLLVYFLRLGATGFGGPIATVGYMQRDLVEGRKWVNEKDFLDGVALGQTMPGPLAAQVVMWVGFLKARALGALATAFAFVLPSLLMVLAFAILYVEYQGLDWVQALFYGIGPAVVAIIALATLKLGRLTNRTDARLWTISGILMTSTAITGAEIAPLIVASGLFMVAWGAAPRLLTRIGGALLITPMSYSLVIGTTTLGTQAALALFFLKAGAFIFGSGLTIVPFLREGVVEQHNWLTEQQFLDAVAIGIITPGPVVITSTFIGYLVGGMAGAAVATLAIFLPIYLGVVVPGPWFVRHRDNQHVQAFVRGATAAASGAMAGATIVIARQMVVDVPTLAIALVSLVALLKLKVKEPVIILLGGCAGLIFG